MTQTAIHYRLPENLLGTILENIVSVKLREVEAAKRKLPAESLESVLDRAPHVRPFRKALERRSPAVIAEIKRASPSAGVLRNGFDPVVIARSYQDAGAAAVSAVTEGKHFQGSLETLARLRWNMKLPLLRKDFIVDPYQILESRHAGADAVLLIAALLDDAALRGLRSDAERCGMDALVEVHDETELKRALDSGAVLIGVNNRDLRTFDVRLDVSLRLAVLIPKGVTAVAESGIHSKADMRKLMEAGYRAFLVGEHLLRAESPGAALAELLRAF